MSSQDITEALRMDPDGLYREEVYSDRRAGVIRRLVPVRRDGSDDPGRPVLFVGQAQILTAVGALPISFEIQASSLGEAAEKFAEAAKQAVEDTMKELEELRREAASRIVVPETGAGGLGGLGGGGLGGGGLGGPGGPAGPGGIPGGGKIQLP
ncbi:MAG TPA: hypothetical protein ENK20_00340 [Chromatiales bacterium]|nr:hypothetical protein [Chromatiales bacterium]